MTLIHNRGSKDSKLWILLERPYESDKQKGYLLSGGLGFVLEKMLIESGLSYNDCYCASRAPDLSNPASFVILENDLNHWKPPLILALGAVGAYFLRELCEKDGSFTPGKLQSNAGSLLRSDLLSYDHYMMPCYDPQRCVADWAERNITTYVDFQKLRDELVYFRKHGVLQPLPTRSLVYGDITLDEIIQHLTTLSKYQYISTDIETVYPRKGSAFLTHPGYPVTIGLAPNSQFGFSFNLFRDDPRENRILWRELDSLFRQVRIIGQNFFNFDALFLEALGFKIKLADVSDTLIRHHILWPELSHKLQFLTRQYTREPYYKDEAHGWSIKNMNKLRRYNCLDVCCTYEIYEAQELEFKQRSHLA